MSTSSGSLPSSTPTFVLLTPPLVELLVALLDSHLSLPADLASALSTRLPSTRPSSPAEAGSTSTDAAAKIRAPEIPYDVVKKIGSWCWTPEGRRELDKRGLDSSSYHPHHLLSLTRTTLPQGLRLPPPSTDPTAKPSPYLPSPIPKSSSSSGKGIFSGGLGAGGAGGKDPGGLFGNVGREVTAILNVAFSSGGVAGGVWVVGRGSGGWSVEKATLLSLLAFLLIVGVETTLYWIYFSKAEAHRVSQDKARDRFMKGGLTIVPIDQQPPLDAMVPLLEIKATEEDAGADAVVEDGVGKGAKGSQRGPRDGLRSRAAVGAKVDEQ